MANIRATSNKGKIVIKGNLSEKKREYGHNAVILEYSGDGAFIGSLPTVEKLNDYGNYMEIQLKDGASANALFQALAGKELEIKKFEAAETTLNEIFIEIVEGKNNG